MEPIAQDGPKHDKERSKKEYSPELLWINRGILVWHISPGVEWKNK